MKTEFEIVAELKSRYNDLSNYQALTIACEIRRNEILKTAFITNDDIEKAAVPEAILAALGKDKIKK